MVALPRRLSTDYPALVERALARLHWSAGRRKVPMWTVAAVVFGVSEADARHLCSQFGFSPEQPIHRLRAPQRSE